MLEVAAAVVSGARSKTDADGLPGGFLSRFEDNLSADFIVGSR